ncbi:MAG: Fic family protein [Solirubrobacterales bacterium]
MIAERELDQPAEELKDEISLTDAEAALRAPFDDPGSATRHPADKAAICCSRLLRARLFSDGNKRIAFESMCELLARAGYPWSWSSGEADEIVAMIDRLQDGTISEAEFAALVRERVTA